MSEPTAPRDRSLSLQRLILAIVGAVSASALYPIGHPRVSEAIDRLLGALESLLIARQQHSITLLMVDDDLVVDQQPFRHAGLQLSGFIHAMRRLGVEGLTIARGLTAEECGRFLSAIAERGTAVSTEHVMVGRVKLAFTGDATNEALAAGSEGGVGAADVGGGSGGGGGGRTGGSGGGAGGRRRGGLVLTTAQLEQGREAFARWRRDRRSSLAVMEALVWTFIDALEATAEIVYPLAELRDHDELTYVHSVNVALLVLAQGRALGLRGELLQQIGLGALLHDIGKLDLPRELLAKPEALTEAEWALVRRHPETGAAHLCELDPTTTIPALVAYEHHLRWDGKPAYPSLKTPRRAILASLMTSIADSFDAMQTARPYAPRQSKPAALAMLRERAGTFLDPLLVESFCRMFSPAPDAPVAAAS